MSAPIIAFAMESPGERFPSYRGRARRWLAAGLVGIQGAGESSSDWEWHKSTLVGAEFIGHPMRPRFQQAKVLIENTDGPVDEHLTGRY